MQENNDKPGSAVDLVMKQTQECLEDFIGDIADQNTVDRATQVIRAACNNTPSIEKSEVDSFILWYRMTYRERFKWFVFNKLTNWGSDLRKVLDQARMELPEGASLEIPDYPKALPKNTLVANVKIKPILSIDYIQTDFTFTGDSDANR